MAAKKTVLQRPAGVLGDVPDPLKLRAMYAEIEAANLIYKQIIRGELKLKEGECVPNAHELRISLCEEVLRQVPGRRVMFFKNGELDGIGAIGGDIAAVIEVDAEASG